MDERTQQMLRFAAGGAYEDGIAAVNAPEQVFSGMNFPGSVF